MSNTAQRVEGLLREIQTQIAQIESNIAKAADAAASVDDDEELRRLADELGQALASLNTAASLTSRLTKKWGGANGQESN